MRQTTRKGKTTVKIVDNLKNKILEKFGGKIIFYQLNKYCSGKISSSLKWLYKPGNWSENKKS